jgi:predicted nucleic acid-binding protein
MILVDTSVWIDYFKGVKGSESPPMPENIPSSVFCSIVHGVDGLCGGTVLSRVTAFHS